MKKPILKKKRSDGSLESISHDPCPPKADNINVETPGSRQGARQGHNVHEYDGCARPGVKK